PFGISHQVDERAPLMLLDAADVDVAVLAFEDLDRLKRPLAQPRADHFDIGPVLERHFQLGGDGLLHRYFDMLAVVVAEPREHRAHRGGGGMSTALIEGLIAESLERRKIAGLRAAAVEVAGSAGA